MSTASFSTAEQFYVARFQVAIATHDRKHMVPEKEKLLFTGIQTFLFNERTEMSLTVGE